MQSLPEGPVVPLPRNHRACLGGHEPGSRGDETPGVRSFRERGAADKYLSIGGGARRLRSDQSNRRTPLSRPPRLAGDCGITFDPLT
jgi:hypothetical protein